MSPCQKAMRVQGMFWMHMSMVVVSNLPKVLHPKVGGCQGCNLMGKMYHYYMVPKPSHQTPKASCHVETWQQQKLKVGSWLFISSGNLLTLCFKLWALKINMYVNAFQQATKNKDKDVCQRCAASYEHQRSKCMSRLHRLCAHYILFIVESLKQTTTSACTL
jgi:hypothetical protein